MERIHDASALVDLRQIVGGEIVRAAGDVPALRVADGVEFCNVTGDFDLWLDGELRKPGMSAHQAAEIARAAVRT